MNAVLKKIISHEVVRNSILLSGGTVLAQLIPLAFMLLLSRYYSNASFGLYNLFYQITVIISVVANGRLEQVVLTTKTDEQADAIMVIATKLCLQAGAVLCFVFALVKLCFPQVALINELQYWLFLLPVAIVLNAQILLLSAKLNRSKQYRQIISSKLVMVALTNIIPAIFIATKGFETPAPLILGYFIGLMFCILYLLRKTTFVWPRRFLFTPHDRLKLKPYGQFLYYSTPAILIDQLAASLPILCFASFYGVAATGDLGFAQRILVIPSVLVAAAVAQVFVKQAADYYHQQKNLYKLTLRAFVVLLLMGVVPYAVIIMYGHAILPFLFGAQWANAAAFAALLAWSGMLKFAVSPISQVMVVTRHVKLQSLWQLLALVGNVGLALLAYVSLEPLQYLRGLLWLDLVLYSVYFLFILYSVKNYN
jgi:O-antigen/teichoic acid export membrane protein